MEQSGGWRRKQSEEKESKGETVKDGRRETVLTELRADSSLTSWTFDAVKLDEDKNH